MYFEKTLSDAREINFLLTVVNKSGVHVAGCLTMRKDSTQFRGVKVKNDTVTTDEKRQWALVVDIDMKTWVFVNGFAHRMGARFPRRPATGCSSLNGVCETVAEIGNLVVLNWLSLETKKSMRCYSKNFYDQGYGSKKDVAKESDLIQKRYMKSRKVTS